MKKTSLLVFVSLLALSFPVLADDDNAGNEAGLDFLLQEMLAEHGFTGRIEETLPARMEREIDPDLADLGRLLFFDEILSLHNDNTCAGCHTPAFGFGDPQSIAYGVGNNRIVGPLRDGTRNSRKAPLLTNVAFFPRLMLNSRFEAPTGDPFDTSQGFVFPPPHDTRFGPDDPLIPNLLSAQAFMPVQDLTEHAGFQGTAGTIGPRFDQFDDGVGTPVPPPPNRADGIWELVLERINGVPEYRQRFAAIFGPGEIPFGWVGQAIAEFQIAQLAADAPIDRFARGETGAMTASMKRGALLFFGEARCVECHAVAGGANEMFSDFQEHVIGVPQIFPPFGAGSSNALFDGPGEDEDFGREQVSGDPDDRYRFRTSPLRNVAVQPAFFHNGAFTSLEDAVRHHLDPVSSAIDYDPEEAGVEEDLHNLGPVAPVLARLDPILQAPIHLDDDEVEDLVAFVRWGLLDQRALPENLCRTVPDRVPSGMPLPFFEGCSQRNVPVCHKGRRTIHVSHAAVYAHLGHGDQVGVCAQQ